MTLSIVLFIVVRLQEHRRNRILNTGSEEERLLYNLFRAYDTDARGVLDANETVTVTIEFLLLRIQGLVCISFIFQFGY